MRKLFSLFLTLVATTSLWAQTFQVGDLYYRITSSTAPYTVEVSGTVSSITSAVIPSTVTYNGTTYSVTSIGDRAFWSCSSLTSVTIGNSVTSIGERAFYGCSYLTSITCLGTTPPTLGTEVFTDLLVVYIPDNTLSAYQTAWGNEYVFVNNETTLTLHVATPGTLSDLIFDAGTRPVMVAKLTLTGTLNDADFTCMRETMTSLVDVDLSGITNTSGVNFNGKARLVRIILPTNLTSIGYRAFYGCSSLSSITIPNSVTSIGESAFGGCSRLTSITIPNSVTSIGDRTFVSCSRLTSITIPNSVTTVGGGMFYGCSKLKSVVLSNNITSLPSYNVSSSSYSGFFEQCFSLTSIVIPDSVTSIGSEAFWGCTSLTSITIGNSVTSIGDNAFDNCSSLTSVTIPNSVTSIGYAAFYQCKKLETLVFGNKIKEIGEYAFYECHKLYHIYCYAPEPPEIEKYVFTNYNVNLYVPCNYLDNYKYDRVFGLFIYIQCIESEDVTTDDVVVTPGTNDVTITWPTEEGADTYTIVIKKDGEVVCTLTFNSEGQLLNIAFAPGRDGNHPAQYAEAVANGGYRFTVTGLEEGTDYTYDITVKDASNQTINSHTGAFTTQSTTAVDNITTTTANIQKIMRNGQLIILRDGVEYNAMGQEIQ